MTDKLHVELSGAPQTMLAMLYAKALDADLPEPILADRYAKDLVDRLDYDWSQTAITARNSIAPTLRSAYFDGWARQFLAAHPTATVLHLGCGLDSRYFRLNPGPDVEWYDVDFPNVTSLRAQLYPAREHYHLVSSSVTDAGYLAEIPADRPTLVLAEGLTIYLTAADGIALLRRVVDRFPSGELQFDAFNRVGIRGQVIIGVVRRAGATLHWSVKGPDDILAAVPGTRLLEWLSPYDLETFRRISRGYRLTSKLISPVPALHYMSQYHRYAFGPPD